MTNLDALKKQIKEPQGKKQTTTTFAKNVSPGQTNQHRKTIIRHNMGNR